MRRTGRTQRIVNYTIDQLLSVGEVIVTDHIVYEFENTAQMKLEPFVNLVKQQIKPKLLDKIVVEHKFIKVIDKWMIHFTLTHKQY